MEKTTLAIFVTIAFSAFGVLGDYFLKLASGESEWFKSKWFYVGFCIYASTAFGWVFVMQHLKLATIGVKPKQMYGTLSLTDRLEVQYSMVFSAADEAENLAKMTRTQLESPSTKQMFDSKVTVQGTTVTLAVGMSESQQASIVGMLGGMLAPD